MSAFLVGGVAVVCFGVGHVMAHEPEHLSWNVLVWCDFLADLVYATSDTNADLYYTQHSTPCRYPTPNTNADLVHHK